VGAVNGTGPKDPNSSSLSGGNTGELAEEISFKEGRGDLDTSN